MFKGWTDSKDIVRAWQFKTGARSERLAVLNAAWEKEMGHLAQHWKLQGVRRGILYVIPKSPAAALELRMRIPTLLRSLNKYFKSAWIKDIKTSALRPARI
ncbi:MAG: DUF721 domain-containing protein [Elusimicrobia bacterium]|nr:DUF721 domain-containing protein [Elusimicrobiota bacterium]